MRLVDNKFDWSKMIPKGNPVLSSDKIGENIAMKPLDILEAVNGARICTSLGSELQLIFYDVHSNYLMIKSSNSEKPYLVSYDEAVKNIYMKPKKVTKYMNVYKTIHGVIIGSCFLYDSEAEAINKNRTGLGETYVKTISFEVEE